MLTEPQIASGPEVSALSFGNTTRYRVLSQRNGFDPSLSEDSDACIIQMHVSGLYDLGALL